MTFAGSEGDPTPARPKALAAFDVASGLWRIPCCSNRPILFVNPVDAQAGGNGNAAVGLEVISE
jgi:hypothetical protein